MLPSVLGDWASSCDPFSPFLCLFLSLSLSLLALRWPSSLEGKHTGFVCACIRQRLAMREKERKRGAPRYPSIFHSLKIFLIHLSAHSNLRSLSRSLAWLGRSLALSGAKSQFHSGSLSLSFYQKAIKSIFKREFYFHSVAAARSALLFKDKRGMGKQPAELFG